MKRFVSRVVCLGLLLLMAGGEVALAQSMISRPSERTRMWEISVQTRYIGSSTQDGAEGSSVSIEDDLGWGFGLAYNYNEKLRFGGIFSWRTVGYTATAVDAMNMNNLINYSGWLDTSNMAASFMYNFLAKNFTPYVTGSIGWAMVDTNIPAGIGVQCWWDPWWGYICAPYGATYGEDGVAYTVGGGVSAQVTQLMLVRVGYEALWVDFGQTHNYNVFRVDLGFLYQ